MNESRVGITPAGVLELTKYNHMVYVQSMTSKVSGFFDRNYKKAGTLIFNTDHSKQKNTPELNSRVLANSNKQKRVE